MLVDFALNKPLTALGILASGLTPAAMPSLSRLLNGKSLTTLDVWNEGLGLLPSPAFCAAVAAAPLVRLHYVQSGLFDALDAGLSLLGAVTGHATLRHLSFGVNSVAPAGCPAVGAALGLLVTADSPLITLDVSHNVVHLQLRGTRRGRSPPHFFDTPTRRGSSGRVEEGRFQRLSLLEPDRQPIGDAPRHRVRAGCVQGLAVVRVGRRTSNHVFRRRILSADRVRLACASREGGLHKARA